MADHSLYSYLQRQPKDLLETILTGYLRSDISAEELNIIYMVLEICKKKQYMDDISIQNWIIKFYDLFEQ